MADTQSYRLNMWCARWTVSFLAGVSLAFAFQGSMQADNGIQAKDLAEVLSDFRYVGVVTFEDRVAGPHTTEPIPLPATLEPNRHYLFLRERGTGNVGWTRLEQRLREKGIRIVSAPKGPADLVYLPIGGPLFKIEFAVDHLTGSIHNAVDRQILGNADLMRKWQVDDLILTLR